MNEQKLLKLHTLQMIIVIALLGVSLTNYGHPLISAGFMVAMLIGIIVLNSNFSDRIKLCNRWLQVLVQPFSLILAWGTLTGFILRLHFLPGLLFVILALIFIAGFLPFLHFYAAEVSNNFLRLLLVIWLFQCAILPLKMYNLSLSIAPVELTFIRTGFVGAIVYLLTILYLLRRWGWGNPFTIARRHDGFNWLVLIILIGLAFLLSLNIIDPAVWAKAGNLQKLRYVLTALEAGLAEEMLSRAAIPAGLGNLLSQTKNHLLWTIVLSSILFGMFHLTNLTAQDLGTTLYQVVMASFSGLFFVLLYLYTGQLWLVMLMHFYTDLASFANSASITITAITADDWIRILIVGAFINAIFVWLMFGKRRQVMELHLDRLSGQKGY
ncbi:MAG: CPBP family intramembrane metalloprotease [Lactobacillus sp.]|jgi:membrane protease YdiL (CAAX protease family)|nr:CPBP family intramembrane metalloprotease [Lactobacillus sp.]MCI1973640.1 CPBP family intramembrane metalloprotease [Lactobacillus sp.]